MNRFLLAATAAAVVLALTSCTGDIVNAPELPQTGATATDYQVVVDASEKLLSDAREYIPESEILSADVSVTDLETDRHRMSCTDTTSQYRNLVNYALADTADNTAIIDEMRESYLADGWERSDSVAEQQGEEQDATGRYQQTLRSPDGYTLSLSRGDDGRGGALLQMSVYSPCIGNPTDKPETWGRF